MSGAVFAEVRASGLAHGKGGCGRLMRKLGDTERSGGLSHAERLDEFLAAGSRGKMGITPHPALRATLSRKGRGHEKGVSPLTRHFVPPSPARGEGMGRRGWTACGVRGGKQVEGIGGGAMMIGVMVVLAGGVLGAAQEGPKERLGAIIKRYGGLKTYSDKGTVTISAKVAGKAQARTAPASIAVERPGKLRIEAGEAAVRSDGKTLVAMVPATNSAIVSPAPKALSPAVLSEGPLGAIWLGGPSGEAPWTIVSLLLAKDPAARLLEGGARVEAGPEREVDGKALPGVLIDRGTGIDVLLTYEPESNLVRRVELVAEPKREEADSPTGAPVTDWSVVWQAGTIATDAVPAETFATDVPVGFKKISGLERPKDADAAKGARTELEGLVGKPAPDFTLEVVAADGSRTKVAKKDLAGKVVVIDFWATWCPPCLKELPELAKMTQELTKRKRPVVVVAVSEDERPEEGTVEELVEKTLKRLELDLRAGDVGKVAVDAKQVMGKAFHVEGLPSLVVIDGEGVVRHVHVGYVDGIRETLEGEIDEVLGKSK